MYNHVYIIQLCTYIYTYTHTHIKIYTYVHTTSARPRYRVTAHIRESLDTLTLRLRAHMTGHRLP